MWGIQFEKIEKIVRIRIYKLLSDRQVSISIVHQIWYIILWRSKSP